MYKTIRILPMDKEEEFKEINNIQALQNDFFLNDLAHRENGQYCYKKNGMATDGCLTLVLFQYNNHIVACADLLKVSKFKEARGNYNGAFDFDTNSIKVFDELNNEEINNIFCADIKFGQTKHYLDSQYQNNFFNSLINIKTPN